MDRMKDLATIESAAEAKGYKAGLRKAAESAEAMSAEKGCYERNPLGPALERLAARLRALAEKE